ncbi:MAG TPA: pyridoxamine 5'-phosphate oxidase family protein [Dehalococcoidales bacterium]|nr:pyridoxamine 5'-phosphate oxidase family protein [Dehalococcoidales bacterium]
MQKKEREITDISEIEAIIKKSINCRIGLIDGDEPYVVPVCFGYERGALYFHGALEGRKVELIEKNDRVSFEMEADVETVFATSPCDWTMKYRSVIGVGKARIVESDGEKIHGLELIMKHYSEGEFSFPKSRLDLSSVVRVDIERITGKQSGY